MSKKKERIGILEMLNKDYEEETLSPNDINNLLEEFEDLPNETDTSGQPVDWNILSEAIDAHDEGRDVLKETLKKSAKNKDNGYNPKGFTVINSEENIYRDEMDEDDSSDIDDNDFNVFDTEMWESSDEEIEGFEEEYEEEEFEEETGYFRGFADFPIPSISIDLYEDRMSKFIDINAGLHQVITMEISDLVKVEEDVDESELSNYVHRKLLNVMGDLEPSYIASKEDFDEIIAPEIKKCDPSRFFVFEDDEIVKIYCISPEDYEDMMNSFRQLLNLGYLKSFFRALEELFHCCGMSFRSKEYDKDIIDSYSGPMNDLLSAMRIDSSESQTNIDIDKFKVYSFEYHDDFDEYKTLVATVTYTNSYEDEPEVEVTSEKSEEIKEENLIIEDKIEENMESEVTQEKSFDDSFNDLFSDVEDESEDDSIELTDQEEYLADPDAAEIEAYGRVVSDDNFNVRKWGSK